jgi:hypothetical protein
MEIVDRPFDPVAFGQAIEAGDVGYQIARYADHAQVQVREVDPNDTSSRPMLQLLGAPAIRTWIHATAAEDAKPPIVTLGVVGDHLVFTARWRHRTGSVDVADGPARPSPFCASGCPDGRGMEPD